MRVGDVRSHDRLPLVNVKSFFNFFDVFIFGFGAIFSCRWEARLYTSPLNYIPSLSQIKVRNWISASSETTKHTQKHCFCFHVADRIFSWLNRRLNDSWLLLSTNWDFFPTYMYAYFLSITYSLPRVSLLLNFCWL